MWPSCRHSGWLLLLAAFALKAAEPLPALHADVRELTVSGVSSGGYMAVQLHVAHSSRIRGVAALAAGPYYCAQGSLWTAYFNCMSPAAWAPVPALETLTRQALTLESSKRIDAITNLRTARIWLFSGSEDRTVTPEVTLALKGFYEAFRAEPILIADKPAGHAMVTEDAGNPCPRTASPFVNDCDYDAAGVLLAHLLGRLRPRAGSDEGRLLQFEQSQYGGKPIGLAETGYAYIPKECEVERCRVHVALHGCRQNAEAVGERFVRDAGYNRWAEANRLIVLYPQTVARSGWSPGAANFVWNPRGCWDWWGYTGPNYHTKEAPQIRAILAMVRRLSETQK